MTRPSDIPPWAWEKAVGIVEAIDADWSKGDFETALSEATRELASAEEERRWFEAVERIARALMEAGPGWQPIETAPRDGSRILLYVPPYGAMSGH